LNDDPLYEAERLRIVYQLITHPPSEGGAGITPKQGDWKNVQAIFALQDAEFNKMWIKNMSRQYFLKAEHLDIIRDRFGEKVAYYFAFTQTYFTFLIINAVAGISAWFLLGHFSSFYAIVNGLWCIIFTEYWKHKEVDLALRWGVRGVSNIEIQRKEFVYDKITEDPVTGEKVKYFPVAKRLQRQLWQIPFAVTVAVALGCWIATVFGIEIFISEVYHGPLKNVLIYIPTGITTLGLPILTGLLQNTANRLTNYENYETHGSYQTALTQKLFIMDIFTSYLGIFLTAFVYVPFGTVIVPYLDIFAHVVRPFAEHEKQMQVDPVKFSINPDRLRKQVIYFTVTAQIVNALLELVVPYVTRKGTAKIKEMQTDYAIKHGGGAKPSLSSNDAPEEVDFLARVRREAALPEYNVDVDTREMVIQVCSSSPS
jgi:anoctamin-10